MSNFFKMIFTTIAVFSFNEGFSRLELIFEVCIIYLYYLQSQKVWGTAVENGAIMVKTKNMDNAGGNWGDVAWQGDFYKLTEPCGSTSIKNFDEVWYICK